MQVITIHLGPYSNYVAAHLWNSEYEHTFGQSDIDSTFTTDDDDSAQQYNANIFFRNVKHASDPSRRSHIPRAIFCDFDNCIPANPVSMVQSQHQERLSSQQAMSSANHFSMFGYSPRPSSQNQPQGGQSSTGDQQPQPIYWHNVLFEHLRPLSRSPKSLVLTAPTHMLGTSAETSSDAAMVLSAASSMKNDISFEEHLHDTIRWYAEECDGLAGFRIIADGDGLWAGVVEALLAHIEQTYGRLAVFLASVYTPLSLTTSTKAMEAFSYVVHSFPHSPHLQGTALHRLEALSRQLTSGSSSSEIDMTPATLRSIAEQREKRIVSLGGLMASVHEHENVIHVPISFPLTTTLVEYISQIIPSIATNRGSSQDDLSTQPQRVKPQAMLGHEQHYQPAYRQSTQEEPSQQLSAKTHKQYIYQQLSPSISPLSMIFAYVSSASISQSLFHVFSPLTIKHDGPSLLDFSTLVFKLRSRPSLSIAQLMSVSNDSLTGYFRQCQITDDHHPQLQPKYSPIFMHQPVGGTSYSIPVISHLSASQKEQAALLAYDSDADEKTQQIATCATSNRISNAYSVIQCPDIDKSIRFELYSQLNQTPSSVFLSIQQPLSVPSSTPTIHWDTIAASLNSADQEYIAMKKSGQHDIPPSLESLMNSSIYSQSSKDRSKRDEHLTSIAIVQRAGYGISKVRSQVTKTHQSSYMVKASFINWEDDDWSELSTNLENILEDMYMI